MQIKAKNGQGTWDVYCPVDIGDVLHTRNAQHPAERWPNTVWTAITGRVLVGLDVNDTDFNVVGKKGGSKLHEHGLNNGYARISMFSGFTDLAQVQKTVPGYQRSHTGFLQTNAGGSNLTQGIATALGGTADNSSTLQPYDTVYIWERTA